MDIKQRFIDSLQASGRDLDINGFELTQVAFRDGESCIQIARALQCPRQVEENVRFRELIRLNLSFNKIRTFPDLRGLTKLCILHFSANLLVDIDTPSFASLVKLRELTLNANSLIQLPASIGDFTKLEKLDISNNRLQRLPNEIGYLCSLVEIRCTGHFSTSCQCMTPCACCAGNPLVEIPRTVRDLGKLENANFDFCHLNSVCSEITYCSRLLELGLAKNRLRELPRDMGRMTRLAMLNISDNQLTDLPITMVERRAIALMSLLSACANAHRVCADRSAILELVLRWMVIQFRLCCGNAL
jgi:hypothetical protein